ncbi:hypothetical protein ACOSQ2_020260 [Xanthoceras sorbifolium]
MTFPVESSSVYAMKKSTIVEEYSQSLRKLWKEWDLRVVVILSLTLQILLSLLGNRRKYSKKLWIRVFVWSSYISADSVATFALGILSSNLKDVFDDENAGSSLDANTQLYVFWAPFLLLHLGGPDAITAYALEDNELWLRHMIGVVVQTAIVVYVFIMGWNGSRFSILSLVMFFVGVVKYGERTWVLRSASSQERKKSIGEEYYHSMNNKTIVPEEYKTKNNEGYIVGGDSIVELQFPIDLLGTNNNFISEGDELLAAYGFLDIIKRLFIDATVNYRERNTSHTVFRNISSEDAFKVIEIELGFMYDLLYTKVPLLFTAWGLGLRLLTFFLTCSVLVLYPVLNDLEKYSKIDLSITFILIVVAIVLEIYAALLSLSSDSFRVWLRLHNKTSTIKALNYVPLLKTPRWSNKMFQYSLLSFTNKADPSYICGIEMENQWNSEISNDLRKLIFLYFKQKADEATTTGQVPFTAIPTTHVGEQLGNNRVIPGTSLKEEFEYSIIIWHIATEIWYYLDREHFPQDSLDLKKCKSIKRISRYMLYLLVKHSSMLSAEMSQISFPGITDAAHDPIKYMVTSTKTEACNFLLRHFPLNDSNNDFNKYSIVVRNALKLVTEMNAASQTLENKWERIGLTWLEILGYAAKKCKVNEHAQQLRRGGEFLSHVWLLLAHFGLTEHFQIVSSDEPRPIARFIAR